LEAFKNQEKIMKNKLLMWVIIITSTFVDAQEIGNPNCDSLLLVSSWFNDNVKIYDGCDGEYIKNLDESGSLKGPQAIFQNTAGDVIVLSESNHRLVKFDQATLSQATTVVAPGLINNPITMVKNGENKIFIGSYSSNEIIELNTDTWQKTRTILPANNGSIRGIDIGMAQGPDGQLYIPGYNSDNVIKVNPNTGAPSQFISSGSGGLDRPRAVLFLPNQVLITAWGNQAIYSYSLTGQFQSEVVSGLMGVAGMTQDGPDHILVTSDALNTVRRYRLSDFSFETIVPIRSGELAGATFVYRLQKSRTTVELTGLQQAFLTGLGNIEDNELLVNAFTTVGGAFGNDFNPTNISFVQWGSILLEFTGCHTALMSYNSDSSVNGVPFGSGSYPVERLAMNPNGQLCENEGFEQMTDSAYMNGTFYGGETRNGEGFTIDYLNTNQAIVTWFTYLPTAAE
jgi:outer membrane protein assembly factor BamB